MKNLIILLCVLALSFSIMGTGNATLTGFNIGSDHFVYDSDQNITWYDTPATTLNWNDAYNWAAALTVGGTTAGSWGLPTTPGTTFGINEGEMGTLYLELGNTVKETTTPQISPFLNIVTTTVHGAPAYQTVYWTGTHVPTGVKGDYWDFFFNADPSLFGDYSGDQYTDYEVGLNYVLAVHSGDIRSAAVPEPTTMLLLGSGLLGLWGFRRKFRK